MIGLCQKGCAVSRVRLKVFARTLHLDENAILIYGGEMT
jgi:hypothetical protein